MNKELNFTEFQSFSKEEWVDKVRKDLKGKPYENLSFETEDNLVFQPFYTKEELLNQEFPFSPSTWSIRQNFEGADLKITNQRILDALMGGIDSLGIFSVFKEDLKLLLKDVKCDYIQLHIKGYIFPEMIYDLHSLLQFPEQAKGTFDNTPLFDSYSKIDAIDTRFWNSLDLSIEKTPNYKAIQVDVASVLNDGGNTTQEIGIALAHGNEYIVALLDKGYDIKTIANQIHFKFSIGSSYFIEIAKIRAFRWCWNQILMSYDDSGKMDFPSTFIHSETSTWNKSVKDVQNNMLRTTTEAMSGILGGADSVSVQRFDNLFEKETDFSLRIARNTLNILKEEAYFDSVTDAAGGSYYIETLTANFATSGWKFFQEIEKKGGAISATENNWIKEQVINSELNKKEAFSTGEKILLGVNKHPMKDEESREPLDNINRLERKDA